MHFRKRYATLLVIAIAVLTAPAVTAQQVWDGSNGNLTYNGTGKVGIGTTAPDNQLHILINNGFPNVPLKLQSIATDSICGLSMKNDVRNWHIRVDGTNGDKLAFFEAGSGTLLTIEPTTGNATFEGTVSGEKITAHYQDLAEWVPSNDDLAPGTVVVLDASIGNGVMASSRAYDTSVAGVVSAQPGILLGVESDRKEMVATTGRVKVRVDAGHAPIAVGDLLVTSDRRGVAMKSEPIEISGRKFHQPGTLIGKALEPLAEGTGEILVLLSLQ